LPCCGFLLGGVGDDDPADLLFAFFEALNNDAVVQRSDVHALYSVCRKVWGSFGLSDRRLEAGLPKNWLRVVWRLGTRPQRLLIICQALALSRRECQHRLTAARGR
jgi:hypothetical protein